MELLSSNYLSPHIYTTDDGNSWAYIDGSISTLSWYTWFCYFLIFRHEDGGIKWVQGLEWNINEVSCGCESGQFFYPMTAMKASKGLEEKAANTAQNLLIWPVNFPLLTIQYKVSSDSWHTVLFNHRPASRLWAIFNQHMCSYSWKSFLTQVTVPFSNRQHDTSCTF